MTRPIHFDITGKDPKSLVPFYTDIFGWKFEKWDGPMEYWMITTGPDSTPGINGGLGKRQKDSNTVNTLGVKDVDAVLKQIKGKGGKVESEKAAIPGIGWFAQFSDPEGNVFGLMQDDPKAK